MAEGFDPTYFVADQFTTLTLADLADAVDAELIEADANSIEELLRSVDFTPIGPPFYVNFEAQPELEFEILPETVIEASAEDILPAFSLMNLADACERAAKDMPCQFHDGISGTCWKGESCVYSHKLGTGGLYAVENADVAVATEARLPEIQHIGLLPEKAKFSRNKKFVCKITHIEDPSSFYITPVDGCFDVLCTCDWADGCGQQSKTESKSPSEQLKEMIDANFDSENNPIKLASQSIWRQRVRAFEAEFRKLEMFDGYKKLQRPKYFPNTELVAVRKNGNWCRALVLSDAVSKVTDGKPFDYLVQLLETGEKLAVYKEDMCQLPKELCDFPVFVFHCSLFGVSPMYTNGWAPEATELFKKLIRGNEVRITAVVKLKPGPSDYTPAFEKDPYSVKLFFSKRGKLVDLVEELATAEYGFKWIPVEEWKGDVAWFIPEPEC